MRGTLYGYNPIIDIVAYFNMCRQILKTKSVKNCSKWFTAYICIVLYMYTEDSASVVLRPVVASMCSHERCVHIRLLFLEAVNEDLYSRYQKQKNYIFNGFCQRIWCKTFSTVNNPFTPVQNQLSPIFVKIKPHEYHLSRSSNPLKFLK